MKKIVMIIITVSFVYAASAQQRPHYTQYILNNYILNPALSGIENYTDLKISGRDQWVNFKGAPQTAYLSVHTALGKQDLRTNATSYDIPGVNPRGQAYWETYEAAKPHHGIGLAVINDKTGNFNRFTSYLSYAYHLGLGPKTNLSAGFSAGITRVGFDAAKANWGNNIPDPVVGNATSEVNKIKPDLGVGLWLYSSNYFIGLSAQQVIPQKLAFVDDASLQTKGKLIPHTFFTAGYRFLLSADINAIPSVMVKYINGAFKNNYQAEFNLKLQYQDLLWIGGSYRQFDGYAAMLGLNVANTFNVGYAYDFTKTAINTYSNGTHELVIGFLIGNKYSEKCPRCMW
jgi:type IX secretion system PorP/SprF family membrane protein